jgi:lipopolysaccharide export system protein LptA
MRPELVISATVLLALHTSVIALPADPQQPIQIEAEKMILDQQNSISTYSGGVTMVQGSILIEADTLIVHLRNNRLDSLEALGSTSEQASFRQQLANGEETRARAGRIEYRAGESRLILKQQAQLHQGGNRIQSERIDYNTASNSLIAGQNRQESPRQQRVRIVIDPADEHQQKNTEKKQP